MSTQAEMETIDTRGAAFVNFWTRMAERNEVNSNTAASLRAAVRKVLEADPEGENLDMRGVDTERLLRRFQVKAAGEGSLKSDSIRTYQQRFQLALSSFLSYADDPANWKPPAGTSANSSPRDRSMKPKAHAAASAQSAPETMHMASAGSLIDYPLPLRGGQIIARLKLPIDLTVEDAERIGMFLRGLAHTPSDA